MIMFQKGKHFISLIDVYKALMNIYDLEKRPT